MADQNNSTVPVSLQSTEDTFSDISDMLLGADALIAQHQEADNNLLSAACNLIRMARDAIVHPVLEC